MNTIDIACTGYAVKADVYEGADDGPVLLSLIGRTSHRSKPHYKDLLPKLADKLGITSVIFDYSGHGESPFEIGETSPALHFLEVINVFDWIEERYPNRKFLVIGSSYGGFLATQLTEYRKFDELILRAPAIYRPEDFYTKLKNIDLDSTGFYRKDIDEILKHPLFSHAASFSGNVSLVVHKQDETVPRQTTDAYAQIFKPEILTVNVSHSMDDANDKQTADYNKKLYDLIAKKVGKK